MSWCPPMDDDPIAMTWEAFSLRRVSRLRMEAVANAALQSRLAWKPFVRQGLSLNSFRSLCHPLLIPSAKGVRGDVGSDELCPSTIGEMVTGEYTTSPTPENGIASYRI